MRRAKRPTRQPRDHRPSPSSRWKPGSSPIQVRFINSVIPANELGSILSFRHSCIRAELKVSVPFFLFRRSGGRAEPVSALSAKGTKIVVQGLMFSWPRPGIHSLSSSFPQRREASLDPASPALSLIRPTWMWEVQICQEQEICPDLILNLSSILPATAPAPVKAAISWVKMPV